MNQTDNSQLRYLAFVDGLRAVAVLGVILYHAGLGVSGGFVGVDVFFVISGYLITGLILKDLKAEKFHITEFWERRVRRIMPALVVVVTACLVAGWWLFFPQDFRDLGQSVLAQAALVSNIYFYFGEGYFAQGVDVKPLLHTWSLAVEEQFYVLFPFLLVVIWRYARRLLVPTIVAAGAVSFCLSIYCSYEHPRANFYFLPTRAWELLTGALLAAIPAQTSARKWIPETISVGGLLAILAAVCLYTRDTRFPGLSAALPCFGTGFVIWANGGTLTSTGRLLATSPLVFIGKISYSLYLWHWPVLVFYKYRMLGQVPAWDRLLLMIVCVALATVSWKFVETPFRKKAVLPQRYKAFAFAGTSTVVLLLAGLTTWKLNGFPSRIPSAALHYLSDGPAVVPVSSTTERHQLSLSDARAGAFNEFGATNTSLPLGLFVWGDSHAEVEIPVLDALCKERGVRGMAATHSQTAPLVGFESKGDWSLGHDSLEYNNAVAEFIHRKNIGNVLIIARWDYYIDTDGGTTRLHRGLIDTINAFQNSGTKVWVMRQVPRYPWNVPKALASAVLHGEDTRELGLTLAAQQAQAKSQDPIFEGIAGHYSKVAILDPTPYFLNGEGRCEVVKNGEALYFDTDHVSLAGNRMLRPLFEPIIALADAPAKSGRGAGADSRPVLQTLSFRESK